MLPAEAQAQACAPGSFSPTGQEPCQEAPAGTFVSTAGATAATPAELGFFVPVAGQSSQTAASAGYYVDTVGAVSATPAGLGFFVPTSGQSFATLAPAGSFVSTIGATSATLAGLGSFVPTAGQSAATPAPPGSFVSTAGATSATLANPGSFVPTSGQSAATLAPPGTFVNTAGATSATPASPGYFVPNAGQTSQQAAAPGFFVPLAGATGALACPGGPGGSFSYGAATACRAGSFAGANTVGPLFASSADPERSLALEGPVSQAALDIFNDTADIASDPDLTGLTLISYSITGPDFLLFSLLGFTPGMVLHMGDIAHLRIQFGPVLPGSYSATLSFLTDQGASFGTPGQSFNFQLSGNYAIGTPEPATLGLLGGALGLLAALRRRRRG
jgi:hypothetical protein